MTYASAALAVRSLDSSDYDKGASLHLLLAIPHTHPTGHSKVNLLTLRILCFRLLAAVGTADYSWRHQQGGI